MQTPTAATRCSSTWIERLYAVIGGFHLSGPIFEPLIPAVCEAFAEMTPEVIVAIHLHTSRLLVGPRV